MDYGKPHQAFDEMIFTLAAGLIPIQICLLRSVTREGVLQWVGKYSFGMYLNEGISLKIQAAWILILNKHISNVCILLESIVASVFMQKFMIEPIVRKVEHQISNKKTN